MSNIDTIEDIEEHKAHFSAKGRDKIAVVVFVIAILGIFAAVIGYMTATHSFDLAASDIDANVGQLDNYATVVFEGTSDTKHVKTKQGFERILDKMADAVAPQENNGNKSESQQQNQGQQTQQNQDNQTDQQNQQNQQNTEGTVPATVDNVTSYYSSKGATTCQIRVSDFSAYSKGQIFERGDWKIGLLSVTETELQEALESKKAQIVKEMVEVDSSKTLTSEEALKKLQSEVEGTQNTITSKSVKQTPQKVKDLQAKIDNLRSNNDAQLVILLSPSQDVLDVVQKVDSVIADKVHSDVATEGQFVGSTYVMPVPPKGSVGAILSSPAKMLSGSVYTRVKEK